MTIAIVFRVHRNGNIAEHGLGTRGRDGHEFVLAADYGIADLVELADDLFVLHFEIRDGGHASWAPVDDIFAAINQPLAFGVLLLIQTHEDFAHRSGEPNVHGEIFARPIDRIAQTLHLLENVA